MVSHVMAIQWSANVRTVLSGLQSAAHTLYCVIHLRLLHQRRETVNVTSQMRYQLHQATNTMCIFVSEYAVICEFLHLLNKEGISA